MVPAYVVLVRQELTAVCIRGKQKTRLRQSLILFNERLPHIFLFVFP